MHHDGGYRAAQSQLTGEAATSQSEESIARRAPYLNKQGAMALEFQSHKQE